ncbi:MAG: hypothetical protein A2107_00610 [Verrucomicrobia bacterium GWF2_62_7]|nr:MAG: hypothetical protein A2107_00610 [Verrucomicrobia bacterium GWF2_62_7]
MTAPTKRPVRLFYSYSHKDEPLRDELEAHLSNLKRLGVINGWHDRKIGAGRDWEKAIDRNLEESTVILLLVSADFIASDYCYNKEMNRALEKHKDGSAVVIPVIVRSVDWKNAAFSHLQALPKDAKPVTSWKNRDKAWTDVAKGIRRAIEERLVNIAVGTMHSGRRRVDNDQGIYEACRRYFKTYTDRHGQIKVLGMSQPVPLRDIYTAVKFMRPEDRQRFASPQDMRTAFLDEGGRGFSLIHKDKMAGVEVANAAQFLNVLGEPGSGKSTFLRRMGLEALMPKRERLYEHMCLPVFVELRSFKTQKINLLEIIEREFGTCGFPAGFGRFALEAGKLLILLDGLDEVPKNKLDESIRHIRDFVDHYDANRFIASCRTAFYQSYFKRFKDVLLADFDNAQIETFIRNWFRSAIDLQQHTAEEFWQTLQAGEHAATLELARTPLLLTFLCLVYDNSQSLPANRSDLYEEALKILMERWASENRRRNETIYKGLTTKLEVLLLEQIAGPMFSASEVFFTQKHLVDKIDDFLRKELNAPKHLDGQQVLKAIEVQQGLFVERAHNLYSFSHLTLQEYLTARYIQNERKVTELITEHLFDKRWREVFLLLAGMSRADDMLTTMTASVDRSLRQNQKTAQLLEWIHDRLPMCKEVTKAAACRAAMFSFIRTGTSASVRDRVIDTPRERLSDKHRDQVLGPMSAQDVTLAQGIALGLEPAFERMFTLERELNLDVPSNVLNSAFALVEEFQKLAMCDTEALNTLRSNLDGLKTVEPLADADLQERIEFGRKVRNALISVFCLQEDLDTWSLAGTQHLERYLFATLLIVECKNAAMSVSTAVWEQVAQRLLFVAKARRRIQRIGSRRGQ